MADTGEVAQSALAKPHTGRRADPSPPVVGRERTGHAPGDRGGAGVWVCSAPLPLVVSCGTNRMDIPDAWGLPGAFKTEAESSVQTPADYYCIPAISRRFIWFRSNGKNGRSYSP